MHLILEIGSYAGLAAIPGLAVLSALYFSQARDVKRLREWAGRAPERAAEHAQGGREATQAAQAEEDARVAQGARAAAAGGGAAPAVPAAAAAALPGRAAASGTVTRPAPAGNGPAAVPRRPAPRLPGSTGSQTAILGSAAAAAAGKPWYRRAQDRLPAPRYVALIVTGVAIVGGGVAYGVTQINTSSKSTSSNAPAAHSKHHVPAVIPSHVTVAVLNGTGVANLAKTEGRRLEAAGFNLGNLDNAVGGVRAQSVVLFKPGANRAAKLVARKLHIDNIEGADPQSVARSGNATVIVIVGQDKVPPGVRPSPTGGGTSGGQGTGGGGTGAPSAPTAPAPGTGGTGTGGTGGTGGAGTGTPGAGTGTGTPGAGGTGTGTP